MAPFCHRHSTDIFILACSKETVKPTELKYALKKRCFMRNKIVVELNLYELAHRSYGLFSMTCKSTLNRCQCHGDRLLEMAT